MFSIYVTIIYFFATAGVPTLGFSILSLLDISTPEVVLTGETCNYGEGELIQIGLGSIDDGFNPQISVCRDPFNTQKIYWSRHFLGKTTSCDYNPLLNFYQAQKLINENLNLDSIRELFDNAKLALLSPDCDFESVLEKLVTHTEENLVLMNNTLYEGNWRELENTIRDIANKNSDSGPVIVVTGALEWTSIGFDLGVDNYANYLYKVIRSSAGLEAYVAVNGEEKKNDRVCNVVKPNCGWPNSAKGKIYCCEIDVELLVRMGLQLEDLEF